MGEIRSIKKATAICTKYSARGFRFWMFSNASFQLEGSCSMATTPQLQIIQDLLLHSPLLCTPKFSLHPRPCQFLFVSLLSHAKYSKPLRYPPLKHKEHGGKDWLPYINRFTPYSERFDRKDATLYLLPNMETSSHHYYRSVCDRHI